MKLRILSAASALGLTLLASHAFADPLSTLQSFTLNDVKAAEAEYAANPGVPTYSAATQCLGYLDATLSAPGAPVSIGSYVAPQGVASTVADLDVALNTAYSGLPPIVLNFNANCGGYIEDLKAEAVYNAGHSVLFGLIRF